MGYINRISLLRRRSPETWCLWISATLDIRHQCVPSIRANSRWNSVSVQQITFQPLFRPRLIASFSHLSGSCHSMRPPAGRQRFRRGTGQILYRRIWQEVQTWCQVQAQSSGQALPGVWKTEKTHERQLLWPAAEHRVLHEWHWCLWTHEQVDQHQTYLSCLYWWFMSWVSPTNLKSCFILTPGVTLKRCVLISWLELSLLFIACWNMPVSRICRRSSLFTPIKKISLSRLLSSGYDLVFFFLPW